MVNHPARTLGALALCLFASLPALALTKGVDYHEVDPSQELPAPGEQVKVTEYFNFSCPACNASQLHIERFLEQQGIDEKIIWNRVPVPFSRWNGLYARTYFVLEAFNQVELVQAVFKAIHVDRKLLNSEGRISEWLAEEHGLDEDKVEKAFDSFGIDTKMRRTERLLERFGVTSTPTFIVADRYLLRAGEGITYDILFDNINELVAEIHAGKIDRRGS